jgi:general secretion pathway protein N
MKLTLDRAVMRFPIWIYLAILLLCAVVVLMQFPVRWVSGFLGEQTACRVVLQEPMGRIWQGSAALGFSETNAIGGGCKPPLAQTERMQWKTHCQITGLRCTTEIQFAALDKPQTLNWGWRQPLTLIANEMTLPATILEGLGNPWITLRPRGDLHARWTDLTWNFSKGGEVIGIGAGAEESSGVMRIVIRNLASPISPVRPLGSYEIQANLAEQRASWVLSTTAGPLLLKGQGEIGRSLNGKGLQFSGEASADPDAEDALLGLLSLLGKKEGSTYRLKL